MELRSTLLLLVGLPVMAALAVGFPLLGVFALTGGPPLETADLVAGALFVGLSWLALFITGRAALRVWRGDGGSVLPTVVVRTSPVLMLLGVVLGVWAAFSLERSHEASSEELVAYDWCNEPTSSAEGCEARAVACLHRAWAGERVDAASLARVQDSLTARRAALEQEAAAHRAQDRFFNDDAIRRLEEVRARLRASGRPPRRAEVERFVGVCVLDR